MLRAFMAGCLALGVLVLPVWGQVDEPGAWQEVGMVEQWQEMDTHFYRIEELAGSLAPRFYGHDQQKDYRQAFQWDSSLPRLGLAEFLALPTRQQDERRSQALQALTRVRRFRNRMADLVMRVLAQQDVGWGLHDMDPRVMDELLGHLQTATGLDPTNPYAWHLLAYFAANGGDLARSLAALDGLDEALAEFPAGSHAQIFQRGQLDRVWVLRDLGRLEQAQVVLDHFTAEVGENLETKVLDGLLAAQSGDMQRAFRFAAEVDGAELPVFQRDWEANTFMPGILDPMAWSAKPSGYLKSWVLALAWLKEGNTAMARKAFGEFSPLRHYYRFGSHFWNDAGAIYEMTGRAVLAERAWGLALIYTPYYPYMVYKPYTADLSGVTGRQGDQSFVLGYDTNYLVGNHLAYGAALVSRAMDSQDRKTQIEEAKKAVAELNICVASGFNTAESHLMLGYAEAVLGKPRLMLEQADLVEQALARPDQNQTSLGAAKKLREAAERELAGSPTAQSFSWKAMSLPWAAGEDLVSVDTRLRKAYQDNPTDGEARRDLARFFIRHGDMDEGLKLAMEPVSPDLFAMNLEDLILVLEVDRMRDYSDRAATIFAQLDKGAAEQWPDSRLWILVGFICQDNGIPGARKALELALELDPGNEGLRRNLAATR